MIKLATLCLALSQQIGHSPVPHAVKELTARRFSEQWHEVNQEHRLFIQENNNCLFKAQYSFKNENFILESKELWPRQSTYSIYDLIEGHKIQPPRIAPEALLQAQKAKTKQSINRAQIILPAIAGLFLSFGFYKMLHNKPRASVRHIRGQVRF